MMKYICSENSSLKVYETFFKMSTWKGALPVGGTTPMQGDLHLEGNDIIETGNIEFFSNNTKDIGSSAKRVRTVYANTVDVPSLNVASINTPSLVTPGLFTINSADVSMSGYLFGGQISTNGPTSIAANTPTQLILVPDNSPSGISSSAWNIGIGGPTFTSSISRTRYFLVIASLTFFATTPTNVTLSIYKVSELGTTPANRFSPGIRTAQFTTAQNSLHTFAYLPIVNGDQLTLVVTSSTSNNLSQISSQIMCIPLF